MTLASILKQLRAGATPHCLGAKYLGQGVERTAYRLGQWVIKKRSRYFSASYRKRAKRAWTRLGIPPIPTRYAGGYMVQPFCRHVAKHRSKAFHRKYDSRIADVHAGNVGYFKGKLYAFDW